MKEKGIERRGERKGEMEWYMEREGWRGKGIGGGRMRERKS